MTFRRRPTVDSPLGDLIAGRIDQAEPRRSDRHPRRNAVMPDRAGLELRVEPAPVRPVIRCSRCGDPLPFGRIGRCDDCTGRGGNPIGCLVLVILAVTIAVIIVAALALAVRLW